VNSSYAQNKKSQIPAKTRWVSEVDNRASSGARGRLVLYDVAGAEPVLITNDFPVKGIDYSPIRINENINFARSLSDIFWDNVLFDPMSPTSNKQTQNYRFHYMNGQCMLPNPTPCRGDLARMNSEFNVNMLRVYGMTSRLLPTRLVDGNYQTYIPEIPEQENPNLVARVTHKQFLDECAAQGIYVMVGLFLDVPFWDKNVWDLQDRDPAIKRQIVWYEKIYKEVVTEVANHPAVMGFCINNEIDGLDIIGKNPVLGNFFWSQINTISREVKRLAPDKLVGVAFHNDTKLTWIAQEHMANVPAIDYWGVNVYVPDTTALSNIFYINQPQDSLLGYSLLPAAAKKPLLFTEIGWPQTTRTINNDECPGRLSITDANTNVTQAVAGLMHRIGGEIVRPSVTKKYPLCPGMYYFEWNDEWYKQATPTCIDNAFINCTWIGTGATNSAFPGGWWDEAGFGIFSTERAAGFNNCAATFDFLPEFNYFGPVQAYDILKLGKSAPNTRQFLAEALRQVYGTVNNLGQPTYENVNRVGDFTNSGDMSTNTEATNIVNLYPNPANGNVTITLPAGTDLASIRILDGQGKLVKNVQTYDSSVSLSTADLIVGLYLVNIKKGSFSATNRLQITH
jgi:hypothetical protein